MYYVLLTLSTFLIAVNTVFQKRYEKRAGATPASALWLLFICGVICIPVGLVCGRLLDGVWWSTWSWFSLGIAALHAATVLAYTLISFRMLEAGQMSVYTLFLMAGGMILPYLYGLIFFDETFSWLRMAGLLCILGGVICANRLRGGTSARYLWMGAAVFLLNGLTSITSAIHQKEPTLPTVTSSEFGVLAFATMAAMSAVAFLCVGGPKSDVLERALRPGTLLLCGGKAALGTVQTVLMLVSVVQLPATVSYPFVSGGTILFSTLLGWALFREKPAPRVWAGVLLCFIGTCLFL